MKISVHVLDGICGKGAEGMSVTLLKMREGVGFQADHLIQVQTDSSGRIENIVPEGHFVEKGVYLLHFDVHSYFAESAGDALDGATYTIRVTEEVLAQGHFHAVLNAAPYLLNFNKGTWQEKKE